MLRRKENLLGRQSRAQDVQGEVCLDNPSVVIDRMTTKCRMTEESRSQVSAKKSGANLGTHIVNYEPVITVDDLACMNARLQTMNFPGNP